MPKPPLSPSLTTRVVLILLRLAIGWHLFIEGATKLDTFVTGPTGTNKPFSSRGYLQQSQGPLGPFFRSLAGDPDQTLLSKLKVQAGSGRAAVPAALQTEWADFVQRYAAHYGLDEAQKGQTEQLLQAHLEKLGEWFLHGSKSITREYAFGSITPNVSVVVRIAEYEKKLAEWHERIDAWNLQFDKDVTKSRISALRGEIAKLRTDLQKDLDDQQEALRQDLDKLLTPAQQEKDIAAFQPVLIKALQSKGYAPENQAAASLRAAVSSAQRADLLALAESDPHAFVGEVQKDSPLKAALMKVSKQQAAPPLHLESTRMLNLADQIVAWGLTLSGLGLLLGCLTRVSCLVGAGLLLLFFLSLPPLPGLPDNPMAEGKYLFVNKNLVEALSLLVLATTRSGRWFGLDALLCWIPPFKWFGGGPAHSKEPKI
jgi:uncharacterized membrane protein YphA (DoxX/SURF4 family)